MPHAKRLLTTTATVVVPAAKSGDVTESGQPAANAKGVKFRRAEKDAALYEAGSGSCVFEVPFPSVNDAMRKQVWIAPARATLLL
jgi:hypothetical protein